MLEAQIPKDIRKYESKLIGPFTLRQTITFVIAGVLGYLSQNTLFPISEDIAKFFTFVLVLIPIMFGWVKPYNIPLEKFLRTVFISHVLAPRHRKYETKNVFEIAGADLSPYSGKEYSKMKKRNKKLARKNEKYIIIK